jgi:hypothetical protein
MKAALAALAPALSAAAAMAPGLRAIDPEQQSARDYFKPGGQFEKDDPGIRQRLHDDEINRRAQEEMRRGREGPTFIPEGRCSPRDPNYPDC